MKAQQLLVLLCVGLLALTALPSSQAKVCDCLLCAVSSVPPPASHARLFLFCWLGDSLWKSPTRSTSTSPSVMNQPVSVIACSASISPVVSFHLTSSPPLLCLIWWTRPNRHGPLREGDSEDCRELPCSVHRRKGCRTGRQASPLREQHLPQDHSELHGPSNVFRRLPSALPFILALPDLLFCLPFHSSDDSFRVATSLRAMDEAVNPSTVAE